MLTENAYETIKYLYDKGYKIYVITNGIVELQKPRIMNSVISPYISDIIVSEEVGASKPNARIFNALLEREKLTSNNVIMIGDSLEKDIKGAHNANIKAIWYNPNCEKCNIDVIPDYQIKDLLEIKELITLTVNE